MKNHYKTLSLNTSATEAEIRRSYRILARRYHPDVNPGGNSRERFQAIAEAYEVLGNTEKRKTYDQKRQLHASSTMASKIYEYKKQQQASATEKYYKAQKADFHRMKSMQKKPASGTKSSVPGFTKSAAEAISNIRKSVSLITIKNLAFRKFKRKSKAENESIILEISITVTDAIQGIRKTVEIERKNKVRKINVKIPPGVTTGSVIRMKSPAVRNQEVVLVIRLAQDPLMSVESRGLILEMPVTVNEALSGASIQVPTLKGAVMLKIPPNTQSGQEFRLRGKGIETPDGVGDMFVKTMIQVPESINAVGLKEKAGELDLYYEEPVRTNFPKNLLKKK